MKRFIAAAVILLLAGCATVPITGRTQLAMVSRNSLIRANEDAYSELIEESELSEDAAEIESVKKTGKRVAEAAEDFMRRQGLSREIEYYNWEFNVIKDDATVNAFCMAGGKIAVYTGMFPVAKDETGLGAVLSHEVAHAVLRHHNERLSQVLLAKIGEATIAGAVRKEPQKTKQLVLGLYGIGTQLGVLLPYSRTQELEADHVGLIIMAMAGYDPREALNLWERMAQAEKRRPLEFLSTHPNPDTRIESIKQELPEALVYYKAQ